MIAFSCSHCGMKLKVKDEFAGRSSKCPTCTQPLVVPQPDRTVGYVPAGQIDGTVSSVHQAGVDGGVTLGSVGGPSTSGQKSVGELLSKGKPSGQRYIIESEIARGGMGAVLRAIDCDIRREVAVKFMLDDKDPKKKARFVEEAQITGQLEHPNIVPIHELGVDAKKRLFFAMKMVKGRSLAQVLDLLRKDPKAADKEYSLSRLLNILVSVCHAMAYAHARGVVHRDLKPANIMVGDFGEVYVMDWGLAKVVGQESASRAQESGKDIEAERFAQFMKAKSPGPTPEDSGATSASGTRVSTSGRDDADLTQEGSVLGTPVYMPPEQAMGEIGAIDQRSDIYSLGAILYEMLTLQAPIEKEGGYMSILIRVSQGEIKSPQERSPQRAKAGTIPSELAAVAMKALAKDRANRYQTAEALRRDIELFQEGRSVSAKGDTVREMVWKLVKRNKGLSAGVGVAFLVLFVSMWFILRSSLEVRAANAEYRREQEQRMQQARDAVPAFLKAARLAVQRAELDDAMTHLDLALSHAPDLADARLLRAQVLLSRKEYAAARSDLDHYLTLKPKDSDSARLAKLCAAGSGDTADGGLTDILLKQEQPALAGVLNRSKEKAKLLPIYQQQIEKTWPGMGGRLQIDRDSRLNLTLNSSSVVDLGPLRGMQLSGLNLGNTRVKDLQPLKGMPLTSLWLEDTPVSDLTPLMGIPLTWLVLSRTPVSDLAPLKGMPLTSLALNGTLVSHLTPLKGMALTTLELRGCGHLSDLSGLEGMLLTSLDLWGAGRVTDLTPLKGLPLTSLEMYECSRVTDIAPLKGMPLTSLNLSRCYEVSDLSPLKGMPLVSLDLSGLKCTDLTPLKGIPLTHLSLAVCPVSDLTPLQGMPLKALDLGQCGKISDLSPLASLKLGTLRLPAKVARGMDQLRKMETLKTIDDKPAADFWKDYNAGKYKGQYEP